MKQQNNENVFKNIEKEVNEKYKFAVEEATKNIKENITEVYVLFKDTLEKTVLHSEKNPKEYISKNIPTELEIIEEKEKDIIQSFEIKFKTKAIIENDIIYAQSTGTGKSVKKEILDYFGVKEETPGKDDKLGNYYFTPTNTFLRMKNRFLAGKLKSGIK